MKIAHVRDKTFTVYIGRPSVLGNPFIIGVHGDRKQCIKKFERYAWKTQRILDAISKLKPKAILGCHCAPKSCHGKVIIRIKKQLTREAREHASTLAERPSSASRKSRTLKDLAQGIP